MFARGLVSVHTPPLLGRKSFEAKSSVSVSSKLIETTGLQLQYFSHLRKTGGRGSYRLVHTPHLPVPAPSPLACPESDRRVYPEPSRRACPPQHQRRRATSSISCISPTYGIQPRISFVSPTYAKTGEYTPPKNVGAPTFLIFPLISCPFSQLATCPPRKAAATQARSAVRSAYATGRWPVSCPLSVSTRQYPAPIAQDLGRTESRGIPAWSGSPRCGYVPFADRCPDAHD
jgi:hypothetical protein